MITYLYALYGSLMFSFLTLYLYHKHLRLLCMASQQKYKGIRFSYSETYQNTVILSPIISPVKTNLVRQECSVLLIHEAAKCGNRKI